MSSLFPAFLAAMLSTRPFRNRYLPTAPLHFLTCPTRDCLSCYDCQMHKMAAGVLDPGSLPAQLTVPIPLATQELAQLLAPYIKLPSNPGEPPNLFSAFIQAAKALNRTQNQHTPRIAVDVPYTSFHFSVEVRTQCMKCLGVRYRTEAVDSLLLPQCDEVNTDASAEEATCRALQSWLEEADVDFKCICCEGSQGKLYVLFFYFADSSLFDSIGDAGRKNSLPFSYSGILGVRTSRLEGTCWTWKYTEPRVFSQTNLNFAKVAPQHPLDQSSLRSRPTSCRHHLPQKGTGSGVLREVGTFGLS